MSAPVGDVPESDESMITRRGKSAIAWSVVTQTTGEASRSTAPLVNSARTTMGVIAVPSRFMNAAICSRDTNSLGQNSEDDVQPSVTLRFLIHSTLPQNG